MNEYTENFYGESRRRARRVRGITLHWCRPDGMQVDRMTYISITVYQHDGTSASKRVASSRESCYLAYRSKFFETSLFWRFCTCRISGRGFCVF
jgi:hypothetical protein